MIRVICRSLLLLRIVEPSSEKLGFCLPCAKILMKSYEFVFANHWVFHIWLRCTPRNSHRKVASLVQENPLHFRVFPLVHFCLSKLPMMSYMVHPHGFLSWCLFAWPVGPVQAHIEYFRGIANPIGVKVGLRTARWRLASSIPGIYWEYNHQWKGLPSGKLT